ncbi:hypothetical protein N9Z65_00215 [bacterium]|nr:hypothetical protein [bacterium]
MKTLNIFKKYEAIYNEADELEIDADATADATDVTEQPPTPEPVSAEGKIFLADLILKAFLHEPDASAAQTAVDLQTKVDEDPNNVISTIASIVQIGEEDLKDTLEQA